eukprot:6696056-Prymnesium_polylepis.1
MSPGAVSGRYARPAVPVTYPGRRRKRRRRRRRLPQNSARVPGYWLARAYRVILILFFWQKQELVLTSRESRTSRFGLGSSLYNFYYKLRGFRHFHFAQICLPLWPFWRCPSRARPAGAARAHTTCHMNEHVHVRAPRPRSPLINTRTGAASS